MFSSMRKTELELIMFSTAKKKQTGSFPYLFLFEFMLFYYLLRLMSSSSNVSDVVMIRLFAWNPLCVVIMSVNC